MKYCILFSLFIACRLYAQFEPERYMGPTFALKDMSNPYGPPSFGPNQKGIYFWRPPDEWYFTTTMARVSDDAANNSPGYVSFISTHTAKSYHPVGVSFGEDANGNKYTIDMSAPFGDTVFVEIENLSNQDLTIRIAIKDANENLVDTKPGTNPAKPWEGILDMALPKNSVRSHAFVYHDGFYGMYDNTNVNTCTLFSDPQHPATPCGVKKTDFTKIAGANITINSYDGENVGVTNAEIRIRKIQFGSLPFQTNLHAEFAAAAPFLISPNPTESRRILFSSTLTQLHIFNSIGELVHSESEADYCDLSNLPPGVYSISCKEGLRRFVLQ